ncbi:hypothetical protein KKC94_04610 [Patescibacteria group bacterium]|nr:hypothetical protein [Patescibacteria group bacterium]
MPQKYKFGEHIVEEGQWTTWHMVDGYWTKSQNDGVWTHNLFADPEMDTDKKRDANHIHIKFRLRPDGTEEFVCCSIKVDRMNETSRRKMIEDVNRLTGLNLSYK